MGSRFNLKEIDLDGLGPLEITSEINNGKVRSKYIKTGQNDSIKYSDDNLKTSISRMIDAIYYSDKAHCPLISNFETGLIYILQEIVRENSFGINPISHI